MKVSMFLIISQEGVSEARRLLKTKISKYHNYNCILTTPLSENGELPSTHWIAYDEMDLETCETFYSILQELKSKGFYYEVSTRYKEHEAQSFYVNLGLKAVPFKYWKAALKSSGWKFEKATGDNQCLPINNGLTPKSRIEKYL